MAKALDGFLGPDRAAFDAVKPEIDSLNDEMERLQAKYY